MLARALLPTDIALHEAASLIAWGSLAISMLVFLPPAALLGTVCPLVVEGLARARQISPGRAGGLVLFVSTLGSLVGVFGTSHVFLPTLGLRRTFWLVSALLLVAGALALLLARGSRDWRGSLPCASLVALSAVVFTPSGPGLRAEQTELASRESTYQALRVVEDRSSGSPLRFLQVNEGFDSFQSVWQERIGPLPEGFYYNDFLLPLSWEQRSPWRVLVLGLGAGTVARVFAGESIEARLVGVELDPAVVELGRSFFDLVEGLQGVTVWPGLDARVALRIGMPAFDQIVLDCYANQVEIPAHLCTLEFFRELREGLTTGGWLTANLGGFDFTDPVVDAVASTCAAAFESAVLLVRVPWSRNYMMLARRDGRMPFSGSTLEAATESSSLVLGPRRLPGFARLLEPNVSYQAMTDDWCPIESLQLRSLLEARTKRLEAGGP
jgi:spermidine synthase